MKNLLLILFLQFSFLGCTQNRNVSQVSDVVKPENNNLLSVLSGVDSVPDISGSLVIIPDKKIKVSSAQASEAQQGEDAGKSIDGNTSSWYHSHWHNTKFPVTLTYYLDNAEVLDYIVYYPRTDMGNNGNFEEIEVWVSTASNPEFVKKGVYNFYGKSSPSGIHFPENIKSPKAVRFVIKSGVNGFASCSEMEFYVKGEQISIPRIFTDETCSELRPGIKKQDMDSISNPFFQRLATLLLNNTYSKEFRIQQYKPYPIPEVAAKKNKTSTYSLLDNPTGICITGKDKELIVFAGNMGKEMLSLRLIDFQKGYSGTDFLLNEGINRFNVATEGLLYVMYHTSNPDAKPVKIHIVTGTINGYYDITKYSANEWNRLLNNAQGNDFDILGQYAHVTFPVTSLKRYCPDNGNRLIQVYDSIAWLEQKLIGLYKYKRENLNRMFFSVDYNMPKAWGAYATSYRTAYPLYSMHALCNPDILRSTYIWGPAHEVGHVNQTRPGFRWGGMGEVSNNVYSMYVQYSFGNSSRLAVEGDAGYGSRYEKGFTEMIAPKALHSTYEDVFCKLIPFWQLELYYSRVKGQTDFYADVHEAIRTRPDPKTDSRAILEFIKICCDVAEEDLTDFFKTWGLLVPVDYEGTYSGYGSGKLTLESTPEQIEAVVRYAEKYPKPAMNLHYIHDDCVDAYRNNAKLVKGSIEIDGKHIKSDGWKNVVVFEVYDNNKLVFVSPKPEFMLPAPVKNPVIYAVSAKGERLK
jgi:hypothetical protein